ncbi:MAG: glycoside hydrolase family 31 protein [Terracidiphilus sp.]|nr:glycoside hydrolase family 31 protein [Terracidiphilus sp.]MDR3776211.1 glycoside hydrolase family 31 protein [Terracidiphilus sp.]
MLRLFNFRPLAAVFVLIALSASSAGTAQTPLSASQPHVALESVSASQPLPDGIAIQSGAATLRITALREDILRVRIAPGSTLPEDTSWAVLPGPRTKTIPVQPLADSAAVGFRTASLDVRVERSPLRLVVRDLAGNILCADALGRPAEFRLGGFTVSKEMPSDAHFFGLGDKTGSFDRRNQAYTLWNTDSGIQSTEDPIYKSIPFFLAISGGRSYGLFLDNTWRTWFDFGKQARAAYSFGSEGGPLDYYLIYGPTPKQVVQGYAYLTGTPPLPPQWALGFQQSRYSYTPETQLRDVANRLRADKIPADAVYLDIDYQYRNRPFTVDPVAFPNFPGLVSDLAKQHFHLVTITDLHIAHLPNQGYMPYDTGHAGDHFVKNPDGSEFVGVVWPGPAVFPDFTRAQTRAWWGGLYKQFVQDGVSGFWNDMNEPSVFSGPGGTMPVDSVHHIDEPGFTSRAASHAEIHNILGMQNERATYEGLLQLRPEERPFVLTRATYAGGQRYGFTWTGDNSSTWSQLRLGTQMLLNLGLSGISMVGDDIGGFGGSATPDLLTRWIEVGAFNPMFRDHSTIGSLPQEVWVHGSEQEAIRRHYIETRYRLLPYIYTLAEEASRTGLPLVRPLFLEFPGEMAGADSEFLLGPDLLVAPPPFAEMPEDFAVSYPKGDWYDFWTGRKMPESPAQPTIVQVSNAIANGESLAQFPAPEKVHPTLDTLPVYVRGGSILPLQPLVQSTDETPQGPLELRVYPGSQCNGSLYLDDGHTFHYQHGEFLRQAFTCQSNASASASTVSIQFEARQGNYVPWWKTIEVVLYGWPSAQAEAKLASSPSHLNTTFDPSTHALHIVLPDVPGKDELRITK